MKETDRRLVEFLAQPGVDRTLMDDDADSRDAHRRAHSRDANQLRTMSVHFEGVLERSEEFLGKRSTTKAELSKGSPGKHSGPSVQ